MQEYWFQGTGKQKGVVLAFGEWCGMVRGKRARWPHLPAAILLIVRPRARLVVGQWADQGGGLLGVRAQVRGQDGVGGRGSPLRVDGEF